MTTTVELRKMIIIDGLMKKVMPLKVKMMMMGKRLDGEFVKNDGGRGHWTEVEFICKCLLEFFLTNFGGDRSNTKQKILKFMCGNSKSDSLHFFPVYILRYVQGKNKNASIEKVFLCDDDGIFLSFNPCILVLKDGHFYNVWDYNRLFNDIDCPNINQKK